MKINPNILQLDIKVQDKFRENLAQLANGNLKLSCVMLGDSDIDYEISQDMSNARILNAPFNVEGIRYPLVYDGPGKGLDGYITCFARKVDSTGAVLGLYNYPTNDTFTNGQLPPKLENGKDFSKLEFDGTKMGYILYFQSLLYNFVDDSTQQLMRLNEKINIKVTFDGSETIPAEWDVVKDNGTRTVTLNNKSYSLYNNSMLIAKNIGGSATNNIKGIIKVTGEFSNITKNITFNL